MCRYTRIVDISDVDICDVDCTVEPGYKSTGYKSTPAIRAILLIPVLSTML